MGLLFMKRKAFTLIELLIVVAIIAILAAIAVPNFLEAQTRSKVSRARADMRALATALESYAVDNHIYPPNDASGPPGTSQFRLDRFGFLTTPVAYITSYPKDPFISTNTVSPGSAIRTFQYFNYDYRYQPPRATAEYVSWGWLVRSEAGVFDIKGAVVKSLGPNAGKREPWANPVAQAGDEGGEWAVYGMLPHLPNSFYDPTNGTISPGDLLRFVGATPGFVQQSQ